MATWTTTMISQHLPFRFFDLPGELRTNILEYLVLFPGDDNDVNANVHAKAEAVLMVPIDVARINGLFLACSQMYREASAVFYGQNRFYLNLGSRRLCDQITEEGHLFSPQCQTIRRRMRNLTLVLRRMGGFFNSVIEPSLSDMILCGNLRNLEIRFSPQNLGKTSMSSDQMTLGANPAVAVDMIHSSPFQALLKLLADPDLEKVELYVWREHWSIWCPFHDVYEGNGSCGRRMAMHGKHWTQVDYKAMGAAYGHGRRIVKVVDTC